jgi:hypothetical protein
VNELDQLKHQQEELEKKLADIQRRREALEAAEAPKAKVRADRRLNESSRSLRDITLDALADAKCPLNSLLLASVITPLHGRSIASSRFGTLSSDEMASFDSKRARPVYLCHCLTHDQGMAMKRYWARSDWSLEDRVVGPMSSRVLFLRGAKWTINLAATATNAVEPERLKYVAADQARDAGLQVRRGEFRFDEWVRAIEAQLNAIGAEDEAVRRAAAVAFDDRLDDREKLFGVNPQFVSLPGSRGSWRSASE